MKQFIFSICVIIASLLLPIDVCAKTSMYPHEEVETELTANEGEVESWKGRTWRTIFGEVRRQDMEYGELRYTVYLPKEYDDGKEYPFLLYLHGGSIGYLRSGGHTPWTKDLNGLDRNFAELIAESIEDCIIFAPQTPGAPQEVKDAVGAYWSEMPSGMVGKTTEDKSESSPYLRAAEKMMADFLEEGISYGEDIYTIDASRLYVAGHSMGGVGTYTILRDCPDMFAAAIIGAGIGDPDSVESWKSTKVRILHGTGDKTIPYETTKVMAAALEGASNAEIIPLEGSGHNIQAYMYMIKNEEGKSENLTWMSEQRLVKPQSPTFMWIVWSVGAAVSMIVIVVIIWVTMKKCKITKIR